MRDNTTKAKIQSGQTCFGCFIRYPDPVLVEVLSYLGWDFVVFDGEHGTIEARDCENMVRAAEVGGVTPIIRVHTNQPSVLLRFMDTGAQGVHVPMVNTQQDAENAVRSLKYHPRGTRGLAGVRAGNYGLAESLGEYVQSANQQTMLMIHIETAEAVQNLPEIVQVDGLDVVFAGPNDLAHSLGYPGQVQHPEVQRTMQQICEQVQAAGKTFGLMVANAEGAALWRTRGARYITIGMENVLGPACRHYLEAARR